MIKRNNKLVYMFLFVFFICVASIPVHAKEKCDECDNKIDEIETDIKEWQENYYKSAFTIENWEFDIENIEYVDGVKVIDIDAQADMTSVREVEDNPFVIGARYAISSCKEGTDTSKAEAMLNDYIANEEREYLVPYRTGFGYRAYIYGDCVSIKQRSYAGTINGEDVYDYFDMPEGAEYIPVCTYDDGIKAVEDLLEEGLNSSGGVRAYTGYNSSNAVNYAVAHATDTPEFNAASNTGSDCANFVSKCINAGGISTNTSENWYPATTYGNPGTAGINWMRTGYYNNGGVVPYFVGKEFIYAVVPSYCNVGSVMYWNSSSHVALVTSLSNGVIKYSQHSNNAMPYVYYTYNSGMNVSFYRFNN